MCLFFCGVGNLVGEENRWKWSFLIHVLGKSCLIHDVICFQGLRIDARNHYFKVICKNGPPLVLGLLIWV